MNRVSEEEVKQSGLPIFNVKNNTWSSYPYEFAVLLTEYRCNKLDVPILGSGREKASAYRTLGSNYESLYDRTGAYEELASKLYPYEIMKQE